ncbi:MAG: hypothetical protein O3A46_07980 [Candidatus Poribacteria bacterium]|nr:hypothetical protein [Candidatus Poribacteria bacterium]
MTTNELNHHQKRLLVFIAGYVRAHESYPTLDEMGAELGRTEGMVRRYLEDLRRRGYIERAKGKWRGIRLTRKGHEAAFHLEWEAAEVPSAPNITGAVPFDPASLRLIPLYGEINAGPLQEMQGRELGWYPWMPAKGASSRCYMLRVRGDSMKDAHIPPGSSVVVDPDAKPEDGRIVVFVVNGETTLKRLKESDGTIILLAENREKDYKPIVVSSVDHAAIQGVVVQVVMTL